MMTELNTLKTERTTNGSGLSRRESSPMVRELTGNREIGEKDPNPLYRPEPSSEY